MYKEMKVMKRYSFAFHIFPKTSKNPPHSETYMTGYHKITDEINGFDTHFFVLGRCRIMVYIKHKHIAGCSCI